ncbi:MAG: hypothetical protein KJP04_10090, partial [Arenicella sp.]|nr:hypothetical protein [Arenicella sp.]
MNSSLMVKNRLVRSKTSKFAALILGTLMLFSMSPVTRAAEHVVTIYFGGTGLTENGYMQGDPRPGYGNTRWDTPSLMAELYRYHDDSAATQHKIFIAGVGAKQTPTNSESPANHCKGDPKKFPLLSPPTEWHAFMQQALANVNICRNWKQTIAEAAMGLDDVLGAIQPSDTVTLNVIGHSRGAIAAFWFVERGFRPHGVLDTGTNSGLFTKVNLVTLEPVPGIDLINSKFDDIEEYPEWPPIWTDSEVANAFPGFTPSFALIKNFIEDTTYISQDPYGTDPMGWDVFRLDSRVSKFVAIYANDERGKKFGAVVPFLENLADPDTDTLMFRVRGSHQTMVGNLWKNGHAPLNFPFACPWPYNFEDVSADQLDAIIDQFKALFNAEADNHLQNWQNNINAALAAGLGPLNDILAALALPPVNLSYLVNLFFDAVGSLKNLLLAPDWLDPVIPLITGYLSEACDGAE